jgi:hypothetical protein
MRSSESLAIRLKDCDFSVSPTKIHIRAEFSKTRVSRDIYISNEATNTFRLGSLGNIGINKNKAISVPNMTTT